MAAKREGVMVGGNYLSREAIEKAYEALQTPEFNPGDRVRYKGSHPTNKEFVVVHHLVAAAHRAYWPNVIAPHAVVLVCLTDGRSYNPSPQDIEHVPPVKR